MSVLARLLGLCALLLAFGGQAKSFEWTGGAGIAALSFPAYRGSSDFQQIVFPIPTLTVRSRDFNLDRDGMQLSLNKSSTLSLRISAAGSLPVKSHNSTIRDGMPDLNSSVEIGPALRWRPRLWRHWEVAPELLFRGVLASDFSSVEGIGWIGQARLNLRWSHERSLIDNADWRLRIGPIFGTHQYHDYFYAVAPQHALPRRPVYRASSGYGGWRTNLSVAVQRERIGFYGYFAYDNLRGAAFADSPLVQQQDYWLVGVMISWRVFGPTKVEL